MAGLWLCLALGGCAGSSDDGAQPPATPTPTPTPTPTTSAGECECAPLPDPTGETRSVSTVAELRAAVDEANASGNLTVLIEDGTYQLDDMLWISGANVTFRGRSGDRDRVVLRGAGMGGAVSHVFNVAASGFTLADVTVGWVANHAVQIHSSADDARIHNLRFVDTGEQMLKVSFVEGDAESAERGEVSCSLFEYTAGVGPQYYIGGVDAHQAHDWVVRDNTFRGIRSPEADLAEHAIHFWSFSRNTLVERNVIADCDRGIGLGLGDRGHVGGTVRNNLVRTTRDVGIGLESADGARVLHNSIVADNYPNAIEYRFGATTGVEIANNLTIGAIAGRDGASGSEAGNVSGAERDWFVDADAGNLRLASAVSAVVDQAVDIDGVDDDVDCQARPRGSAADVGADEW